MPSPMPSLKQRATPPLHPGNGTGARKIGSSESETLTHLLQSAQDEVKKLASEKQQLQQENEMLKIKVQTQMDLAAVLQQECGSKDTEIQRLYMQREIDKDERAELSRKLEEALEAISALQRERNMKLDAAVTGQVCFSAR